MNKTKKKLFRENLKRQQTAEIQMVKVSDKWELRIAPHNWLGSDLIVIPFNRCDIQRVIT